MENQLAERDRVATRITARGTQPAWRLGIQPTGKQVVVAGINFRQGVNGRIVEHGGATNMLQPFLLIGAAVKVVVGDKAMSKHDCLSVHGQ